MANTKFKTTKVKGVWNSPSREKEKIMALESAIGKTKKGKPKVEMKNKNKYGGKKDVRNFKDERKKRID